MAKAPSEEQLQLRRRARRRLIGAIALVTLIAVVLPWLLEHEPRPSEEAISIQIPSQDAKPFTPKIAPEVVAPAEKAQAEGERAAAAESKPSAPPAGDDGLRAEQDKVLAAPARTPAAKPAAKDKAAAEAKKKAPEKTEAAGDAKQYVVQVAALADADKAADIQRQLAAKGLKAYTEKVKTAAGEMTRVRVGPFPSREAADKERGRVKALGFDANVTPR
jgi:DedD protein